MIYFIKYLYSESIYILIYINIYLIYFIVYFYNYVFNNTHRHYETPQAAGGVRWLIPPPQGELKRRTNPHRHWGSPREEPPEGRCRISPPGTTHGRAASPVLPRPALPFAGVVKHLVLSEVERKKKKNPLKIHHLGVSDEH